MCSFVVHVNFLKIYTLKLNTDIPRFIISSIRNIIYYNDTLFLQFFPSKASLIMNIVLKTYFLSLCLNSSSALQKIQLNLCIFKFGLYQLII